MRLLFIVAFMVVLAVVAAQLNAERLTDPTSADAPPALPLVVGTSFPEPISTVFLLGGAAAMAMWRVARRFAIV